LFYPHALRSVFGLDAGILTDLCLDLDQLGREHGFYLSEQLCSALSAEEQVRCLSEYLFFLVRRHSAHADEVMAYALRQMMQSKGNITLKELQDRLCLSERSVERRFRQYVGLSPKLFARICRFQASLHQLRDSRYEKLSDIAYENDYADQSHLIRSFKEFAGVAPNNFQRQSSLLETPLPHTITTEDPLVGFVLFYGLQRS
jgi:transcriptional regulator GlxA family with amidase domain